ncbi:Voltage-dependent calcium channel beta subunit-associated regulatory protein [Liparis tanakae]|uniref:Voltage-dependent calcium channel beta subunit-associated regulatory protein n=1 Tax=Liparis tanakae TaxID=230148 RepID=A0A4Z2G5Z4_9TELE|nr:Voltage-dependent calcium channel beta subunit-associated regulatory protein [Liparis tanakae]
MMGAGPRGRGGVGDGDGPAAGSQGPVLQFFTKLRRHASLEGSSPYFKIKRWKLDSSQRASSLDTRGDGASMETRQRGVICLDNGRVMTNVT